MPELVALPVPSARFIQDLRRVWEDGDAVFPLDLRLAAPAREAVLRAMAPAWLCDEHGERQPLEDARPVEEGDALVVATSGTTGTPRGVVLTHDAVHASAIATSDRIGVDPRTDRWLACLPLSHVGGLSVVDTRDRHRYTGRDRSRLRRGDGLATALARDARSCRSCPPRSVASTRPCSG